MNYAELIFKLIGNMPSDLYHLASEYVRSEYMNANMQIGETELNYPVTGVPEDVATDPEFKQLVDYKEFTRWLSQCFSCIKLM